MILALLIVKNMEILIWCYEIIRALKLLQYYLALLYLLHDQITLLDGA